MSASFFVTGTDTGVGKTVVAAILAQRAGAYYWKPVQSGLEGETDSEAVARMVGLEPERILPEAYRLQMPASPNIAASAEGVKIARARLMLPPARPIVVEGAGGLLVPLNEEATMLDLIGWLGLPVVLVARTALGTINHTLLSLEAFERRGIPVAAVILNGEPVPATTATIRHWSRRWSRAPVLELPRLASLTPAELGRAGSTHLGELGHG